jgi:ATP-dependent DNA ligase
MPLCEPAGSEKRTMASTTTREKMKDCRWLRPVLVGQFEFTEWTSENHLRHSQFVGLREDKRATDVVREMHR